LVSLFPFSRFGSFSAAGTGIVVRINDVGVDANHPDLSAKFDADASCANYLPPDKTIDGYDHGTVCAALAAAGGNSECSVGIAPDATISACSILGDPSDDAFAEYIEQQKHLYDPAIVNQDVSSNSYGNDPCPNRIRPSRRLQESCPFLPEAAAADSPCAQTSACAEQDWSSEEVPGVCETAIVNYCLATGNFEKDIEACTSYLNLSVDCNFQAQIPLEIAALTDGVTFGRGGKGVVYLFSAGNEFEEGEVINFETPLNSRYTIT
jgi:subtilisin family serine protease